eukprot:scaffold652159_cov43-Prasinocladus_malaysianus.AAC.1
MVEQKGVDWQWTLQCDDTAKISCHWKNHQQLILYGRPVRPTMALAALCSALASEPHVRCLLESELDVRTDEYVETAFQPGNPPACNGLGDGVLGFIMGGLGFRSNAGGGRPAREVLRSKEEAFWDLPYRLAVLGGDGERARFCVGEAGLGCFMASSVDWERAGAVDMFRTSRFGFFGFVFCEFGLFVGSKH